MQIVKFQRCKNLSTVSCVIIQSLLKFKDFEHVTAQKYICERKWNLIIQNPVEIERIYRNNDVHLFRPTAIDELLLIGGK